MRHPKILAIILAGGQGGRLDILTEWRAKPVMPFAGSYRLIDFPLSHCAHSGITDVWIVEQYQPYRLNEHLANGRPWDLDRLHGGLRVLPPYAARGEQENEGAGFAEGNADALWRNRAHIRELDPDLLLVLSADHVYRMDFRDIIDAHRSGKVTPAVTVAVTPLPPGEDATRFGNVVMNRSGKITKFAYKPEKPVSDWVTAEVFLYDARRLLETLEGLAGANGGGADGNAPLKDFGDELLPHLVKEGHACAFRHEAYWRDVGTVPSYFHISREFLSPDPPFPLDDPAWPIRTFSEPRSPARIDGPQARVEDSLISPGCRIRGKVIRSILSPGVVVEAGATVRDCILFENVTVRAGATLDRAIVDEEAEVGPEARAGSARASDEKITLIGRRVRVEKSGRIAAGERVAPPEEGV